MIDATQDQNHKKLAVSVNADGEGHHVFGELDANNNNDAMKLAMDSYKGAKANGLL